MNRPRPGNEDRAFEASFEPASGWRGGGAFKLSSPFCYPYDRIWCQTMAVSSDYVLIMCDSVSEMLRRWSRGDRVRFDVLLVLVQIVGVTKNLFLLLRYG